MPVSMHLLVLSAFRQERVDLPLLGDRVSMHLLVLSAFRRGYWAVRGTPTRVSMHLLVLSAFRPKTPASQLADVLRLNAPFGAQCFPTSGVFAGKELLS